MSSSKLVFCFYYCRKGSERRTESESSVVLFEFLFLQLRLLERFLSLFSFTWERRVVKSIKVVFIYRLKNLLCWRDLVFASGLKSHSSSRTNLRLVGDVLHTADERKTRVYCFSMRKNTTTQSGVALDQ